MTGANTAQVTTDPDLCRLEIYDSLMARGGLWMMHVLPELKEQRDESGIIDGPYSVKASIG